MTPTVEPESEESTGDEFPLYNVIIIGAGPAGLTAAIYAARARLSTLVLAGSLPGGQPINTDVVENFPGFPDEIKGAELAQRFQNQAEHFGAQIAMESATEVELSAPPFTIRTDTGGYKAQAVIIATGAIPRRLGVPGEEEFLGRGVSTCAVCDGFFYQEKRVAVVGGGDSAIVEAIYLTKFAREVVVIHRRDQLRATKIYQEQISANPKIRLEWDSVVKEIVGDQTVTGVRVRNVKTDETKVIKVDGVFVYIGVDPQTEMFAGQLERDEQGYIVSDRRQHTSVPGVFVAGDVQDPRYRQLVVAAGTGAIAAMEAEWFLGE
ncbi:MAG: thioredoxin-disulfide reductase [Anaerolineae bacterium]